MTKTLIDYSRHKADIYKQVADLVDNLGYLDKPEFKATIKLDEYVTEVTKGLADPRIYIKADALVKIQALVDEYSTEVAAHLIVTRLDQQFIIEDVLVFPQYVTAATADGIDTEYELWLHDHPDEVFDKIRGHIHSHVNMGVSPSSTDELYYFNLIKQVKDHYITIVINKKGETHMRLYDVTNNVKYTDLEYTVLLQEDDKAVSEWLEQCKDNVKKEPVRAFTATRETITTKKKELNAYQFILVTPTGGMEWHATWDRVLTSIADKAGVRGLKHKDISNHLTRDGYIAINKTEERRFVEEKVLSRADLNDSKKYDVYEAEVVDYESY